MDIQNKLEGLLVTVEKQGEYILKLQSIIDTQQLELAKLNTSVEMLMEGRNKKAIYRKKIRRTEEEQLLIKKIITPTEPIEDDESHNDVIMVYNSTDYIKYMEESKIAKNENKPVPYHLNQYDEYGSIRDLNRYITNAKEQLNSMYNDKPPTLVLYQKNQLTDYIAPIGPQKITWDNISASHIFQLFYNPSGEKKGYHIIDTSKKSYRRSRELVPSYYALVATVEYSPNSVDYMKKIKEILDEIELIKRVKYHKTQFYSSINVNHIRIVIRNMFNTYSNIMDVEGVRRNPRSRKI